MKISEILFKAADLIEPEGAWTQKAFSRDKDGEADDDLVADRPVCWCALGAIAKAADFDPAQPWYGAAEDAEIALAQCVPNKDVPAWNDAPERTQAEVVQALREAATKAQEQGQ